MKRWGLALFSFLLLLTIGLTTHAGEMTPPEINHPDWEAAYSFSGKTWYIHTSSIKLANNILTWWTKVVIPAGQNTTKAGIYKCEVMLGNPQKERYHHYTLNPSGKLTKEYVSNWENFNPAEIAGANIERVSKIINLTYPLDPHWYRDVKNGYLVWNPSPVEGESVEWDGPFVDINGLQYASGAGKASWYEGGVFSQQDEGTLLHGKRHGRFVQTLADGREVVTYWNNGEKINNVPEIVATIPVQWAIPPQFSTLNKHGSAAGPFWEGLARVEINNKYGFIDKTGQMVIVPQFEDTGDNQIFFTEGLAKVYINGKFGFIDRTGKIAIAPHFNYVGAFWEGLACVGINDKYGFIDKNDQIVIPLQYDQPSAFSEGLAIVKINSKYGIIDKTGQMVVAPQFDKFQGPFENGLARVVMNNKYGFIDRTGQIVVAPQFSDAYSFREGLAAIRTESKYGFIDKQGRMVIPSQFDDAEDFHEGLAVVQVNGNYGFIDKTGKLVIEPQFDGAWIFREGLAAVKVGDKWGFIDKTGKMVIAPQFEKATTFKEGLAAVKISGKYGYISKEQ